MNFLLKSSRFPMITRTTMNSRFFMSSAAAVGEINKHSDNIKIPADCTPGEKILYSKLIESFDPSSIKVNDVSGGCGAMYAVDIVSYKFKGIPLVRQHQMVNQVLKEDIKGFHGIQIRTKAE